MAITNSNERQYALTAYSHFKPANLGANNGVAFKLPPGAILLRLTATTITGFDGTTPVLTVSDGTTTFVNAVDLASTGAETVTVVPKRYPTGGTITASGTVTGSPTAGLAAVVLEYIVENRANEAQE